VRSGRERGRGHTSQRLKTESLDICRGIIVGCGAVVVLDEVDDVEDGEHSGEDRLFAVPEGRGDDAVEQETLESLLHTELGVEDDEPKRDGECVVRGVVLEEGTDASEGGVVPFSRGIRREMRPRPVACPPGLHSSLKIIAVTLRPSHPPLFLFLMFDDDDGRRSHPDALLVLLPLLVILSTFLFLLLAFLVCVLIVRRRRGIVLRDSDGPVDMSREELIEGDGRFENIEAAWLQDTSELSTRTYLRAKGTRPTCCTAHLSMFFLRIPGSISPKLPTHRHHPISVSLHSGERCIRLVFRTRF